MQGNLTYEALARAFAAEGVDTIFMLSGEGNMHWSHAMETSHGARLFHVRHEHCAVAMALSYAMATRKVGVAATTCGPGVTQIMTALVTGVYAKIPLVIFVGETPLHSLWHGQRTDQASIVKATGARYIAAHSPPRMLDAVREAFFTARTEQVPVVLGIPYDLQDQPFAGTPDYLPSDRLVPTAGRMAPDPDLVEQCVARILAAKRMVVIGGRGAYRSEAEAECEALAESCGALLATTLPANGMFDHNPFSVGIAGGFTLREPAREALAESDLVVAVGASLTYFTLDGGRLFANADIIQIDENPAGFKHGLKSADLFVKADARAALRAINERLRQSNIKPQGRRSAELARRLAEAPVAAKVFDPNPGAIDPRDAVAALDRILPKDWEIVLGSGHCTFFTSQLRGRSHRTYHAIREFSAIGNGLSFAIGVAAARPDNTVVLLDGDGSFMMHLQELDTLRRYGLRILICLMNDGAYGSEVHMLRADGFDVSSAIFGHGDYGRIARGFDLAGAKVTELGQLDGLFADFQRHKGAALWDIQITDQVAAPAGVRLKATPGPR